MQQLYEIVKKIHSQLSSKPNGFIHLACLQFFLHHSEAIFYDADLAFRSFFDQYLSKQCMYIWHLAFGMQANQRAYTHAMQPLY
jgi:hypothetical protein